MRRVYRIFLRYADESVRIDRGGPALIAADGTQIGQVERSAVAGTRLEIAGWVRAPRVALKLPHSTLWAETAQTGPDTAARFAFDAPLEPGPLAVEPAGAPATPLPGFSAPRIALARAGRALPFLWSLVTLVPQIWRWKRRGDMGAREVVKERLGLVPQAMAGPLEAAVLAAPTAPARPHDRVILIMPVYNARDLTQAALARVAAHTRLDWHLIVIEDASTDPKLRPWLETWAAAPAQAGRVTLLCNDTNLGFIGAVNRGFETAAARDPEAPVVLLNSDAMVPEGWDLRLLAPLADPAVASVTPMSNDAEIFTVPAICRRHDLAEGEADALDQAAATLNAPAAYVPAPTGVGFCMALAPGFLRRLPRFDTAFGRGYGEETDWCQKARALGGRHVAAVDLFVEHRGGASFGSAAKQRLLERNLAEISRRYPRYDGEVQDFVRHDPLATARLALGLSWAAARTDGPVPVYLAHAMGGGAEMDLRRRIAAANAAGAPSVVLRVGQGVRWKLELHSEQGVTAGISDETGLIRQLIARLPRRRIIYSCGVGDRDPVTLPGLLLALAGHGAEALPGGPQPIEVLTHDFFPVSPSYTLLTGAGRYAGVPRPGSPAGADAAHHLRSAAGTETDLPAWQAAWAPLMAAADRIEVFSPSSQAILAEVFPKAAPALVLAPHTLHAQVPPIAPPPPASGPVTIGVLGNIGQHKGAAVLSSLSRDLAAAGQARLVVIGHMDPSFGLTAPSRVHGAYALADLPGLVARYGIRGWFIPSIWPETFSFVTHEALATGLPVAAFALGGQGDAVAAAPNGHALPLPDATGRVDPAVILPLFRPDEAL